MDKHLDDTLTLARETLTGDLRDFVLDTLKNEKDPLPWHLRPESVQRDTVDRVTMTVNRAVERAIEIMAADGRVVIMATIEQVRVKDKIQAVLAMNKADPNRHLLLDATGDQVLVALASADEYTGTRGDVPITKDQGSFDDDDEGPLFDKTPSAKRS
jgi:hypothetical protein